MNYFKRYNKIYNEEWEKGFKYLKNNEYKLYFKSRTYMYFLPIILLFQEK